jgi:hypothetical protein
VAAALEVKPPLAVAEQQTLVAVVVVVATTVLKEPAVTVDQALLFFRTLEHNAALAAL